MLTSSEKEHQPKNDTCAMLFSGGLDTSLEVIARLKDYQNIFLLTFNNGYCINMKGALKRSQELQQRFGADRISFKIVNTAPLIKRLLQNSDELWRQYRSPLTYDLACKMSSLTYLILYAKRHNIIDISDGGAIEQTQIFLQHPDFTKFINPWLASYGMNHMKPIYFEKTRQEKLDMLTKEDLRSGPRALEKIHITSQIAHQPFCLRGIITYLFTSPSRKFKLVQKFGLSLPQAKELWNQIQPLADEFLKQELV